MRIKIIASETKEAIPKAIVVIKDHDIKRKSSPKGQILVRNLKEGNHLVSVSIKGYSTQAVQAIYKVGATTKVTVEMVKLI